MSNLWITVEVPPGATISSACDQAVALANKIELTIWFKFNGIKCLALPGDNPRKIESNWRRLMYEGKAKDEPLLSRPNLFKGDAPPATEHFQCKETGRSLIHRDMSCTVSADTARATIDFTPATTAELVCLLDALKLYRKDKAVPLQQTAKDLEDAIWKTLDERNH